MRLEDAIKACRTRRKESGRAFAALIGADQGNLSKYESGKVVPSYKVLVNILRLAEGEERSPLLAALGVDNPGEPQMPKKKVDSALRTFEQYLQSGGTGLGNLDPSQRRFLEVVKLVAEGEIEPALTGILEKWVKHRGNPRSRRFFKNLDVYLDIELREKK